MEGQVGCRRGLRERAVEVRTAHHRHAGGVVRHHACGTRGVERHVVFLGIRVIDAVLLGEEVFELFAGEVVQLLVRVRGKRKLHFVVCVVRICDVGRAVKVAGFHHADDVFACVEFIITLHAVVVRVEVIPGSEVLHVEGDDDRFALARLQDVRLCKADQNDAGLFNAAHGVGRGDVDLRDFLARDVAGVGDGDREVQGLDLRFCAGCGIKVRRVHGRAERGRQRCVGEQLARIHGEAGVGQTEAERERDVCVIPFLRACRILGVHVIVVGLVVLVAEVDAFLVVDAVIGVGRFGGGAFGTGLRAVLIEVGAVGAHLGVVAEVVPGRIRGEVHGPFVHKVTGRAHKTRNDLRKALETADAGTADVDDRADGRVVLEIVDLDRVGGVEHDDDVIEVRLDVLDELQLGARQHQAVLHGNAVHGVERLMIVALFRRFLVAVCRLGRGSVAALAAFTGDDDERRVLVNLERRLDGAAEVDRLVADRGAVAVIERFQRRVDVEADLLQRVRNGFVAATFVAAPCACGVGSAHQVIGANAEHADPCAVLKRQGSVVLHEDRAVRDELGGKLFRRRLGVLHVLKVGVILKVVLVRRKSASDH